MPMRMALVSCPSQDLTILRAGIPPGCVARRLHTPGMRAPHALPGGRLDAHNAHLILLRALRGIDRDEASRRNDHQPRTGGVPVRSARDAALRASQWARSHRDE